jgi:hypothetical protein
MSRAADLTEQLSRLGPRPAGSDAERRAAAWTARQINADPRRHAELETFWSRPNWAGAQAWHILLAVGGSLLASTAAKPGAAVVLVALIAMLADWVYAVSPGRLLTRERASQNVVSAGGHERRVRLIITANLDTATLDPDHTGAAPGWLFWIVLATVWVLITAIVRIEGGRSDLLAVAQLIPTVALILSFTALLIAGRPADNANGVAAALALVRLLDAAPPAHMAVDLVITGAGAGDGLGLRRYLRARRRSMNVTNTVVLGIGAGTGAYYLTSDGPLLPQGAFGELRRLAQATAMLSPRTGRSCGPALPARLRGLPALTIGGDPDAVVAAALELVDGIDAYLAGLAS